MTGQGPRSLRGCLGAETTSARHRVVVSATLITNTKWWKGTMTAWESGRDTAWRDRFVRESWMWPLCVQKNRRGFWLWRKSAEWPLWRLWSYSVDYRSARQLLYRKNGNVQRSYTFVFTMEIIKRQTPRLDNLIWKRKQSWTVKLLSRLSVVNLTKQLSDSTLTQCTCVVHKVFLFNDGFICNISNTVV